MRTVSTLEQGPRKHALTFYSEEPLAPFETRLLPCQRRVEAEFSDLPVYGVTTLADGGSCRPRALRIGDRWVPLAESAAVPGLLIVQGAPVLLGERGATVCLSLEVRNKAHHPSDFHGLVLLGDWGELAADLQPPPACQGGGHCQVPASGGACPGCNYPRAYAHPSRLLDAFLVDQIYVGGTAVQVYPDPGVTPGLVQVVQRDGRLDEYPIPPGDPGQQAIGGPPTSPEVVEHRLLRANPRQLRAGLDSPAEILNPLAQARLLEYSATLLRGGGHGSLRDLALALAEGVAALAQGYHGHLNYRSLQVLRKAVECPSSHPQAAAIRPVASEVRTILSELDVLPSTSRSGRAKRVCSVRVESRVVVDDCRLITRPWASYGTTQPFLGVVSRIRVALLPGEADHVRIYDLQILSPDDNGATPASVLDRIPGYGPSIVREGPPAQVGGTYMSRYLPGSALAGQVRDGVSLDYPYSLSPSDLSGGVLIDLGRSLPPLSRICFLYQVEPGHLFCAAVEPA